MAQIRLSKNGQTLFVGHFIDAKRFTLQEYKYRSRNTDWALEAAQMLRDAGHDARAITNDGQPLQSEAAIVSKNAPPVLDTRPTTWRGVTPEKINGRFFVRWYDKLADQHYDVSGVSPQEALEKLFGSTHPAAERYVATLPEESEPTPQPAEAAPVTGAPVDNRVLRPGDNRQALPPREIPQIAPADHDAEYSHFESVASVAQLKERVKRDAAFALWYGRTQQLAAAQPQKGFF